MFWGRHCDNIYRALTTGTKYHKATGPGSIERKRDNLIFAPFLRASRLSFAPRGFPSRLAPFLRAFPSRLAPFLRASRLFFAPRAFFRAFFSRLFFAPFFRAFFSRLTFHAFFSCLFSAVFPAPYSRPRVFFAKSSLNYS